MNLSHCKKCDSELYVNASGRRYCQICATARSKKWKEANRDRVNAAQKVWRLAHPESLANDYKKHKEARKATSDAWKARNKHKNAAASSRRRAQELKATPKWANEFFMLEMFDLAALRTKATGIKWEVDHIVPLQGKNVCGLHVENNLRVIPMVSNRQKYNHFDGGL